MSKQPIKKSNDSSQSGSFVKQLRKKFFFSIAGSAVLTLLIAVPVIGMFPYLLTLPLSYFWDLGKTGEFVEYGFMWITIKKTWLWPVFFAYFFVILFLLQGAVILIERGLQKIFRRKLGR